MNCTLLENANLAQYCSMKTGGNAKYVALPKNEEELIYAISFFRQRNEKYVVVGNCSNLLFTDDGFDGGVIILTAMRGISFKDGIITANCGESLSALAKCALDNGVTGMEFCYGIPGTVGGAIYMNAGAYGGEICQCFIKGRFLDESLNIVTLSNEELDFSYRNSLLQRKNLLFLSGEFKGENGDKSAIRAKMDELMAARKSKQPLEYPSCGSTFKRPPNNFAGALIEQCGLKGYTIGGAQVSEKHAGFVINIGNATSADVLNLMDYVTATVLEKTGVKLEPEIRVIR